MLVDFSLHVDRRGTHSLKWDLYPDDVLPLWVADMDFPSPPAVVEALRRRAAHGVYGYALPPESLKEAIVERCAGRYGWQVQREWIVFLPGVVPGLTLGAAAFAEPGEAVLTIVPAYPPFLEVPPARGRELITVPAARAEGRWELPLEAMEAAVTDGTRVLLFCHPHNPLGRVWRADEVAAVLDFCRRHRLVLVSDEIHCDLVLDDLPHVPAASLPQAGELTVTLMSPSKTFNLPGLDFAWAVVPDAGLRERFKAAADGYLPLPGCFAVAAAEAAYREGDAWLQELLAYLRGNRDLVERVVRERLPHVTTSHVEATYLAWLDVRACGLPDAARACRDAKLALSAGAAFGDAGGLRLNFGCPRGTLEEALRRLELALTA
jgi:cysteine-S-conjugate beta-lyase